jgi:DNA polymerase III delta prime subunit
MKEKTLEAHIKNNSLSPAYLLVDRDILKLKEIAKQLSQQFNTADIFHLEGTPNILVKETEEFIARAHLAAVGGKKLFVICDAATMTPQAQNKILKTIEDTPASTHFLLLASSDVPILNTIKSRCVIIYPDPVNPSLTETAILNGNPNTKQIFAAAEAILKCKTLDETLPHLPVLTKKENLGISMIALNQYAASLTIPKRTAILKAMSIINRNIDAGCNPVNAFDILLMELFK